MRKLKAALQKEGLLSTSDVDPGYTIAEGYFHLSNGGVSLRVYDAGSGLVLSLRNNSFDAMGGAVEFRPSAAALRYIGAMCLAASEAEGISKGYSPMEPPDEKDQHRFYSLNDGEIAAAVQKVLSAVAESKVIR